MVLVAVMGLLIFQSLIKVLTSKSSLTEASKLDVDNPFISNYQLKVQFCLQCTPDEILKLLLNDKKRFLWDHGLQTAKISNNSTELQLSYPQSLQDQSEPSEYTENIQFKYMISDEKFYIIENVTNHKGEKYERIWILE